MAVGGGDVKPHVSLMPIGWLIGEIIYPAQKLLMREHFEIFPGLELAFEIPVAANNHMAIVKPVFGAWHAVGVPGTLQQA